MINVSKVLVATALLILMFAIVLKIANARCDVGFMNIRLLSLLVVSNTCLLLGLFLKK